MHMDRLSLEQLRLLRNGLAERADAAKVGMMKSGQCVDCYEKLKLAVEVIGSIIERETKEPNG